MKIKEIVVLKKVCVIKEKQRVVGLNIKEGKSFLYYKSFVEVWQKYCLDEDCVV